MALLNVPLEEKELLAILDCLLFCEGHKEEVKLGVDITELNDLVTRMATAHARAVRINKWLPKTQEEDEEITNV